MWTNNDVVALMKLLREMRDELKRINERQHRINEQVPEKLLVLRKAKNRKRLPRKS